MNCLNTRFFFILVFTFISRYAGSQTLIMNEVSNGPSGNQEYVEFVVVSNSVAYNCGNTTPPCIDIRGWIFDDNSGYHGSGGVASGAVRFSQNPLWSCVPLGTIILIYNNADRNPAIPPDDLSMSDGNCTIVAPINNTSLFESNATTPGASACSYPATGWTAGGNWNNTLLANPGDCARIVNLSGCEVFSVCWGTDNLNNLIYFAGSGSQTVWYFNGNNPAVQSNWSNGSASPSPGNQTPGAPNNATNAAYIAQFNNGCQPITPLQVTATTVNAGCTCNGSATANATGSIGGYTYVWYDAAFNPIGQTNATATGLCAGVYNVIAKSHIGCSDTLSVTITSTSSTSVAVSSKTICGGGSAVLTATPSASGGTYLWSPGGQTTSSVSVNPSSSTSYSVTYTLAGCAATATTNVTVSPNPSISISSSGICAGQSATLTASGAATYTWNTGANSNPLIVSPGSTTNYTVTGTSAAGCTNSSLGTVSVNPSPTVTVNSSTICAGQTATLMAAGATTYTWDNGSATSLLTVSPSTGASYTVTGTTAGCTNTAVANVIVNPGPVITVNSSTICTGQTATLTANGATTYTWSNGANSNSIAVSPASVTSYTVTGTGTGCTNTAIATVDVSSLPSVTMNAPLICADQSATLTANGAATYTWNTGSNSNPLVVSPVSSTNYTVTGSSAAGCTNSVVGTVTVNPSPTVSVNSSTICSGQTATLTANGASSYTWDTGSTSNPFMITPSVSTSYTVTGMTAGCTNTAVSTVSVISSPSLTVNSLTVCTGKTATLTASGAGTYTWSTGSTSGSLIVSPPSTTTYSVTGALSGCFGSGTATVQVIPQPTISITTPTICAGETATLTANGATSYTWSSGSTLNPFIASPASTSTYTVTGDNGGCTNTATTVVTVNPLPVITVNSPTICLGQTATLTAGGATSYSWSNGSASSSVSVSPPVTTTYSVAGTLSGCISTATTGVIVNSFSVTVNSTGICAGQTATLVANGATTYTWDNGSTANSITVSPLVNSSYTVTGSAGSCTNSAVASVTIIPTPTITVNSPTICAGQTATLTANGGTGYIWNTGSGNASINVSPVVTTSYSVTGSQAGCNGLATATVVVSPSPTITVNSAIICAGQSATLIAGGATTYTWNTGSISHSITASPATTTTYTVTGTTAGCSSGAMGTISITPLPPVTVSSSSICIGQTATLTANGATTYSWSNGASTGTLNVSPATTSTYAVTGTINHCSAMQTGTVYVSPMPVINFSADKIADCAPLCVNFSDLTAISSGSISNWQWSLGNGATSALPNPNYCYTNAGTYTVGLTVTTSGGCTVSLSHNNMITVFETPVAEFTSDFQGDDSFDPTVQFTNLSTNASSYYWSFGDSYASTETDPLHPFVQAGVYSTSLIAISSAHNCRDTVVHEISVKGLFTFYAPNAFTPNNDMVNDVFLPTGIGWDTNTYKLLIFDRWGNLCFSTQDPLVGWNGKANKGSEVAQIDTYTWKVQVNDIYGQDHRFIGRVTILK